MFHLNSRCKANLTFEALATLGSTEIIQSPNVLTLDNREAKIEIIREIRFAEETTTTGENTSQTTLAEAESSPVEEGIDITVIPHITDDGFVSLDLDASDKFNDFETFSFGDRSITLPQG